MSPVYIHVETRPAFPKATAKSITYRYKSSYVVRVLHMEHYSWDGLLNIGFRYCLRNGEGYVFIVVRCFVCLSVFLSVCLLAALWKTAERIFMKFSG